MIQTEVKKLGTDEHAVNVQVAQPEYDRVYATHLSKLQAKLKLPGFRPGKTPKGVVEKQFGAKAHEDTMSELVQNYFIEAIEQSGLTPAIQPELEFPDVQPTTGFQFTLKVVTWPEVKLKKISKLSFTDTTVEVVESDIQSVIDRLMESQMRYEVEEGRKAVKGDEVIMDFTGFVDNEAFEGGQGEDAKLVLGSGRFIPGFEDQLEGVQAGEDSSLDVTFPEDYQNESLAGKEARFEVHIKGVGAPVKASDEDDLARMLNFDDAKALHEDVRTRLTSEAEQAQFDMNRTAAFDALLAANDVHVPEIMVRQDMQQTRSRLAKSMRQQGMDLDNNILDTPEYEETLRQGSERRLAISLLLNAVRETHEISVNDADVDVELDRQAKQYPEDQHDAFTDWMHGKKDQIAELRDKLLEKKCVVCMMEQAKTKSACITLEEWQQKQDAADADTQADDIREAA